MGDCLERLANNVSYRVERVKEIKNYSINERLELVDENIRVIVNPFSNLLEMVEEYFNVNFIGYPKIIVTLK